MKNSFNPNIFHTLKHDLCTGCGVCQGICPTKAISIIEKDGEYRPTINKELCINNKGCHRCLDVCPGAEVPLMRIAQESFQDRSIKTDKYIGRYTNLYTGHSNDDNIRYHSASGGVLSQFLIYLLEANLIDGVVVTRYSAKDNITPEPFIARTKEEILSAKSSKYCPVHMGGVSDLIKEKEGRYVVVGLPCHIQGFRKQAEKDKKLKEKVVGYFAIYCSSNRTFNARDFLFETYASEKSKIRYFAFRDEGCLGSMVINTGDNAVKIPFINYYGSIRSFFKPRRCLTCVDHYGELADICFGDIHIKPYSDDKIGVNSLIARSEYWDKILADAVKSGKLTLNSVDTFTLNESQTAMLYPKKRKAKALMNVDEFLGRSSVKYDFTITDKPTAKDYISVMVMNIQRFIGRHRSLWFVVSYLYKKRNK